MAHEHRFTDLVHHGVFFVAILSIVIVLVERQLDFPEPMKLEELPEQVQAWKKMGNMVKVNGYDMFALQVGPQDAKESVVFFHGFPTSSFDYAKPLEYLKTAFSNKKLVFFDHVGFGFSDKPHENFEFTLHDHAENALELLRKLNIKSAHFVAHDMGDSVLTEILTRRHFKLLPEYFDSFFKSVTFTNGGMHYDLINFRLSQTLLNLPYIGAFLSSLNAKLPNGVSGWIAKRQLSSIWGPSSSESDMNEDMDAILALMRFNEGQIVGHKTISYLKDRARFESRWYRALKHLDIPCMLLWGDSDAVAPMDIPKYLATNVIPPKIMTGKYLKDTGHFVMLEKPEEWSLVLANFINSN